MKEYPKTYEDCYTRPSVLKKCKIEHVTTDKGLSALEYRDLFEKELRKIMENTFDTVVKFVWLQSRFTYMGYRRKKIGSNSHMADGGFAVFMRHFVGIDYRIYSRTYFYAKIASYFKDFFKDFDNHNPFEEPEYYKYPYKHVTVDFLTMVSQMPNRLELLQLAEDRKMKWDIFMDYIINYSLCHNDEIGKKMYTVMSPVSTCPPYIRNNMRKHVPGKQKII